MGFDTATEVALLATTGPLRLSACPVVRHHLPPHPLHRGDDPHGHHDGIFMTVAYGWAFFNPVRKVYLQPRLTGLSGRDLLRSSVGSSPLGLAPRRRSQPVQNHGFLGLHVQLQCQHPPASVIVGMFVFTWTAAVAHLALREHRGEVDRPAEAQRGQVRPRPS